MRIDPLQGQVAPVFVIPPPGPRHPARPFGRNKARVYGLPRVLVGYSSYHRQDTYHPGGMPGRLESEEVLHIDAQMNCAIAQRAEPKVLQCSFPRELSQGRFSTSLTTASTASSLNGLRRNAAYRPFAASS